MWSTNSAVADAVPPMSDKRVHIGPREFLSIKKTNSPVVHVVECCGALTAFNYKIIDQCQDSEKSTTIEALHISRRKSHLNTRDEYKSRDLKLKNKCRMLVLPKNFRIAMRATLNCGSKQKSPIHNANRKSLIFRVLKFF